MAEVEATTTVLELYCGLGGLHQAYTMCGGVGRVVPYDINDVATKVYEHNFGGKVIRTNLETITVEEIDRHRASLWLMSPPCQPYNDCVMCSLPFLPTAFSRAELLTPALSTAKKLDMDDARSNSLRHILLEVLPRLQHKPDRILLENVRGFRNSDTHNDIAATLAATGYAIKEVLLSPVQLGIPNQRQRYFLLAKRQPLQFLCDPWEHRSLLGVSCDGTSSLSVPPSAALPQPPQCTAPSCTRCHLGTCVSFYLDGGSAVVQRLSVPKKILLSHGLKFDIVWRHSTRTSCFTKGYSRLVEGAGSVLQQRGDKLAEGITDPQDLLQLDLRYFSPTEVLRLHGFPPSFTFPQGLTDRQQLRLLGNSLNCIVVSHILQYLLDD